MTLAEKLSAIREALEVIQRGDGPYSRDPLVHAGNCIDAAKEHATTALSALDSIEVLSDEDVDAVAHKIYNNRVNYFPEPLDRVQDNALRQRFMRSQGREL